jgi:hypothetical protein
LQQALQPLLTWLHGMQQCGSNYKQALLLASADGMMMMMMMLASAA